MSAATLATSITREPPTGQLEAALVHPAEADPTRPTAAAERVRQKQLHEALCDLRCRIFGLVVLQLEAIAQASSVPFRGTEINFRNGIALLYVKPVSDGIRLEAITSDSGEPSLDIRLLIKGFVRDTWTILPASGINPLSVTYSLDSTSFPVSTGRNLDLRHGLSDLYQATSHMLDVHIATVLAERLHDHQRT